MRAKCSTGGGVGLRIKVLKEELDRIEALVEADIIDLDMDLIIKIEQMGKEIEVLRCWDSDS